MPVEVKGLEEVLKAMRKLSPELYKQMNKEIKPELKLLVEASREKIPSSFTGLSNWKSSNAGQGRFPLFDPEVVKSSYKYKLGASRRTGSGWISRYSIYTTSPAAAIAEFAGTVHPDGQPWTGRRGAAGKRYSHSNNPKAGKHFIEAIAAVRKAVKIGNTWGRIMYEAVYENNGRAKKVAINAIEKALEQSGFKK